MTMPNGKRTQKTSKTRKVATQQAPTTKKPQRATAARVTRRRSFTLPLPT